MHLDDRVYEDRRRNPAQVPVYMEGCCTVEQAKQASGAVGVEADVSVFPL